MNKREKLPYHVSLRLRLMWKEESTKNSRRRERERIAGKGWTKQEWRAHLDVYGNKCLRCGSVDGLVPDHVVPLWRGGAHELHNIQPLCHLCNFRKGLKIIDYRQN